MTQLRPANVFMDLIVTFLTPIFLPVTEGDLDQARAAALQTVNAYTARDPTDLLMIAQAIALGLAVLSSISLSMAENLPINLVLRLRGNANSLHRAAGRCRDALSQPSLAAQVRQPVMVEVDHPEKHAVDILMEAQPAPIPDILPPEDLTDPPVTTKAATADARWRVAEADAALKATDRPSPAPSSGSITPASTAGEECRRTAWSVLMAAQACAAGIATLPLTDCSEASVAAAALGTTFNEPIQRVPGLPAQSTASS